MYSVARRRHLIAQHVFDVPGPEGVVHSHPYVVEVTVSGEELDERGYLVDLDRLDEVLEAALEGLRDRVLNELPAFRDRTPSVENLARTVWEMTVPRLADPGPTRARVTVWESGEAWASYEREIG
jgi:6-pyruvoyltetrahydropterin/6-carboxytetrahydropterin synthase